MLILLNTPRANDNLSSAPAKSAVPKATPALPAETFTPSSTQMEERHSLRKMHLTARKCEAFVANVATATVPAAVLNYGIEKMGLAQTGAQWVGVGTVAAGLALAAHHAFAKDDATATQPGMASALAGLAGGVAMTATFNPGLAAGMGAAMVVAFGAAHIYNRTHQG